MTEDQQSDPKEDSAPLSTLPDTLAEFTRGLMGDLVKLRNGEITNKDARVRALLAREVLRSVHLGLEGSRILSDKAKQIGSSGPDEVDNTTDE